MLWPRPAVLPRPEPMPRPTRRLACLAPSWGLMLLSSMSCDSGSEYLDQVADLVAQAAHGVAVRLLGTNVATHQLDLDGVLCGHDRSNQPRMSSTDLPRLAATSEGVVEFFSARSEEHTSELQSQSNL